jgi:uncharacterized membrane protein YoaK (UPF0700 family)
LASAATPTSAPATPSLAQSAAARITHPLTLTLLGLTFTAGTVDAVTYLGLGHVFSANMTGNVILLGFGIASVRGLPVVSPLVSLAAFLLGAGLGGILARRLVARQVAHLTSALAVEAALIAAAAILAAAAHPHAGALSADILIALLALAMGLRNAVVRRIAVPDLTTTVLTMTLTALAAELPLAGGSGGGTTRRTAAVLAMLAGALAGALMLKTTLALPLGFAAALAFACGVAYPALSRREVS